MVSYHWLQVEWVSQKQIFPLQIDTIVVKSMLFAILPGRFVCALYAHLCLSNINETVLMGPRFVFLVRLYSFNYK